MSCVSDSAGRPACTQAWIDRQDGGYIFYIYIFIHICDCEILFSEGWGGGESKCMDFPTLGEIHTCVCGSDSGDVT